MYLCNFLIFSQIFTLTLQHITICCNGRDKRQLMKQHSIFEMSSHFASTFGLKWKLFYYNNTFIDRITLNQLAYQMKHSDFLAVNFNSHPNVIKLLNSSVLTLHVVPIFNLVMAKKLIDSEHSLVMSQKDIVETVGNTPINNFLIQVPKNWTNKMIMNTFDNSSLRLNSMTFVFRYETNYTIVIYEMYKIASDMSPVISEFAIWNKEHRLILSSSYIWTRRATLNGYHFEAASGIALPLVTYLEDGCSSRQCFKGFFADIWHDLSTELNFTYTLYKRNQWGSLVNGSWNGMVGMLHKGEIDIAPTDITVTKERSKAVDFLPTMTEGYHQLYLKNPLDSLNWFAYTEPLTYDCWLATFLYVLMLTAILMQERRYISNKIATISVILGGTFIYWHWEAMLISFLAVRKIGLPLMTLKDLSKSSSYGLMVQKGTIYEDLFKYANNHFSIKLWNDKIRNNIEEYPTDERDVLQSLLGTSNMVVYGGQSMKSYDAYFSCKIVDTGVSFYQEQLAFAMPKKSPYFDLFHFHINRLKENGKMQRYRQLYEGRQQMCPDYSGQPISMMQCFTTFLIITSGFIMSTIWLVLELFLPRKVMKPFRKGFDGAYEKMDIHVTFDSQIRRRVSIKKQRFS